MEEFVTGVRPEKEIDRVLATVLFTDIVDSTKVAADQGDAAWRGLLDRHNAIVRTCLAEYRGREIKTTGDGFLATFDGPARAIRCARAIVADVGETGIEVRAGLHSGEVEMVGDDVAGIAVNTAARVADEAGPTEVLVSQTVRDLVAGSGIAFEDRGTHVLKGVPGEWRLFSVSSC
jgi:class 3 adenylate cyclase